MVRKCSRRSIVSAASLCNWRIYQLSRSKINLLVKKMLLIGSLLASAISDRIGRIVGVRLVHHTEPIAILGLKDDALHEFTQHYIGHDITTGVDIVSELSSSVLGAGSFSQRSFPGAEASAKLAALGAPQIHYLSCDPSTLARDLAVLTGSAKKPSGVAECSARYEIAEMHLFDLFPQTFHIETLVRLRRAP